MGEYERVVKDTSLSLDMNKANIKAYARRAKGRRLDAVFELQILFPLAATPSTSKITVLLACSSSQHMKRWRSTRMHWKVQSRQGNIVMLSSLWLMDLCVRPFQTGALPSH